jgi:peptidoglycan/xylan/chitin deacetylase (PgdA/CDA1 family)
MLRKLVKTGVAVGLRATGGNRLLARIGGFRRLPVIICYHRTVEEFPADPQRTIPSLCVSTKMLEQHLDWLGRQFRLVSLDDLSKLMASGSQLPDRVAAITFDDGYQDFYELAFPILKRKGIPAAVFVVTDTVGTERMQVHDLLYLLLSRSSHKNPQATLDQWMARQSQEELLRTIEGLEKKIEIPDRIRREHRSMNWQEVAEVHKAGITIGSHTQTHVLLPNETKERVARELRESRRTLEGKLGGNIRHFAYPCGEFSASTVGAVANAGYSFGYTICRHRDGDFPSLTIPRKVLWEKSCLNALRSFSPSIMSCHVGGSFDLLGGCRLSHAAA